MHNFLLSPPVNMKFCWLFFILFCVSVTTSEKQKNSCSSEEIGRSLCRCEYIYPESVIPESETEYEIKLICIGDDSLKVAPKYLSSSRKHLIVSKLIVSNGSFEIIHHSDLQYFMKLRNISFSHNRLFMIGLKAFKNQNSSLKSLDLSLNKFTSLSNSWFESLGNLKNLSFSSNQVHTIESEAFVGLSNLLYLDLSNNQLTAIYCNWFTAAKKLEYLLLNNNKISFVNGNFYLLHLLHLDLSFNHIKSIQVATFLRLRNLKFLSLAMNELTMLNESTFKGNVHLESINITGNFWVCDRKLLPLNKWLKKYEASVYKEGAICTDPPELHNYPVQHGLDYLHLEVETEESPICNKTMCNCSISKDKLVITVDCSNRQFTRLPEVVPYKTRVLNLQNNKIKSLTIDHINAVLWSDVSFLYLNNNIIDSLNALEGSWLLRNLVAMHLSNNRLTKIPIHILEQLRGGNLDELFLSGNPWNCDCNTVLFQTWLQDSYRAVRNIENICCSAKSGIYANHPIYQMKKSQLCPQQVQWINYLDILNGLMAVAILLIITKLSYDYYLQKRTGKLPRFFSLNL